MTDAETARKALAAHTKATGHVLDVIAAPARTSGEKPGLLAGVPFGVKDLFDVAGRTTLAGSAVWRGRPAAGRSADAVELLEEAGAIVVATLSMDEFAHGFTGNNPHNGWCRNPHNQARIAGGSSGGSAVAVALGDVPFALGSDTNGSVRVPASLCGVYGVKPGHARVSARGMAAFAPSLDHVGFFARSAAECLRVLNVLMPDASPQPRERPVPARPRISSVRSDQIARFASAAALQAAEFAAKSLGVESAVEVPPFERAMDASLLITAAEAADVHHGLLRTEQEAMGISARIGMTAGSFVPAADLLVAERYRAWLRRQYTSLFESIDVLLLPSTPDIAPLLEDPYLGDVAGVRRDREPYLGIFTIPFSLIGFPAVSVPVETGSVMPLGIQLVGAPGSERLLLEVAQSLESTLGLTSQATLS